MNGQYFIERLIAEIQDKRDAGESYHSIGQYYGVNKGIIWAILNSDYEPQDNSTRRRLGLPVSPTVNFFKQDEWEWVRVGMKQVQLQALSVRECECGQYFIPNAPKRRKCFICTPYRSRKNDE